MPFCESYTGLILPGALYACMLPGGHDGPHRLELHDRTIEWADDVCGFLDNAGVDEAAVRAHWTSPAG